MKIEFVFQHPESKEYKVSPQYTVLELVDKFMDDIMDDTLMCDCQPVGETNVVECNCDDYYEDFVLVKARYYNGDTVIVEPLEGYSE